MSETLQVYQATEDDTEGACGHCGDEIELGSDVAWEPDESSIPGKRLVYVVHAHCAVEDGFRLEWPA